MKGPLFLNPTLHNIMVSDARYARCVSKQLLADALAREASANKMFESARENLDEARDKVRAAKAVLKETEEKWPEIVIDDDASTDSPPLKTRQKIAASSSTGGIAIATATTGGIVAAATVDRSSHVTGGISDLVRVCNATPDISTIGDLRKHLFGSLS
jgi:hypothetical protein